MQVSKFPHKVFGSLFGPSVRFEYAAVYFDETEAIAKAVRNESRAKNQGMHVGNVSQQESQFLNLKKSESGEESVVVLNRLLEYIYVSHKANMSDQCILFCDAFFSYVQTRGEEKYVLEASTDLQVLLTLHNRPEFRPELVSTTPFTSKPTELVVMLQMVLWLKVHCLARMNESMRIVENFVKFSQYFFKPFKITGIDHQSDNLIKNIWKINFISENLRSADAFSKQGHERTQQWMVSLLSVLQGSLYEIAKTFYKYNDEVARGNTVLRPFRTASSAHRERGRGL